jgi:hypothetical protein
MLKRYEIVLGFLAATALWATVLVLTSDTSVSSYVGCFDKASALITALATVVITMARRACLN